MGGAVARLLRWLLRHITDGALDVTWTRSDLHITNLRVRRRAHSSPSGDVEKPGYRC